jgi:hypothetical protein
METEKIIFFRNFLFSTFIVGVVFAVIYFIGTIAFWHTWVSWAVNIFKVSEADVGKFTMAFFMFIRIIIVFGFLAPCIALPLDGKEEKKR